MRLVVWFAAVVWVSWLGYTASELDPGQQAKASTVIDSAQFILNAIDEDTKAAAKALKDAQKISSEMTSVDILQKQTKLAAFGSKVGKAL